MKKVLITGAGSYVGESVRKYILANSPELFQIDAVDTMDDNWKKVDYSLYDVVFHVAGIAHVNADPKMEPLYYKVNRDLTIEIARHAQEAGVKQFIFMSSQIVFHESQSLKTEVLTAETKPNPNGFYGDSKLQAELGLKALRAEGGQMKMCILRPCMIYVRMLRVTSLDWLSWDVRFLCSRHGITSAQCCTSIIWQSLCYRRSIVSWRVRSTRRTVSRRIRWRLSVSLQRSQDIRFG